MFQAFGCNMLWDTGDNAKRGVLIDVSGYERASLTFERPTFDIKQ
jgi:hypothetical protein